MCTGIPLRVAHGTEFKSKAYTSKEKTKDTTWVSWRLRPGIHLWRRYPLPTPEKRAFLSSVGGCEPDSLCFARRKVDTKCDLRHQKNKGHSLRVSFIFMACHQATNSPISKKWEGSHTAGTEHTTRQRAFAVSASRGAESYNRCSSGTSIAKLPPSSIPLKVHRRNLSRAAYP